MFCAHRSSASVLSSRPLSTPLPTMLEQSTPSPSTPAPAGCICVFAASASAQATRSSFPRSRSSPPPTRFAWARHAHFCRHRPGHVESRSTKGRSCHHVQNTRHSRRSHVWASGRHGCASRHRETPSLACGGRRLRGNWRRISRTKSRRDRRAGVFAFYPNKQITTGEGGMIVTNDSALAEMGARAAQPGPREPRRMA